jgi:integrase
MKSFWVVTRDKKGKQKWVRLGDAEIGIDAARDHAITQLRLIRNSTDTTATPIVLNTSVEAVAKKFLELHVAKEGLRSERLIRAYVRRHIIAAFAGMDFVDFKRTHIAELLDRVEKDSGRRTANYTFSVISKMCHWYALRDGEYTVPIIPGMKRGKSKARDRVLTDAEIATLWKADGLFGNFTKFALLTLQRADKLYTMRWADVVEEREKGNAIALRLPQIALDVLERQRDLGNGDFVFAYSSQPALRGRLERDRQRFEKVNSMAHWTLHDLRRTGRSRMAEIGVLDLHAELIMGHALTGVIGIYNRHDYFEEKGEALIRLANRIRDIVAPPPSNVENFKRRKVA